MAHLALKTITHLKIKWKWRSTNILIFCREIIVSTDGKQRRAHTRKTLYKLWNGQSHVTHSVVSSHLPHRDMSVNHIGTSERCHFIQIDTTISCLYFTNILIFCREIIVSTDGKQRRAHTRKTLYKLWNINII
jgi:hypothetical protein